MCTSEHGAGSKTDVLAASQPSTSGSHPAVSDITVSLVRAKLGVFALDVFSCFLCTTNGCAASSTILHQHDPSRKEYQLRDSLRASSIVSVEMDFCIQCSPHLSLWKSI